jgi:hypothetical protein
MCSGRDEAEELEKLKRKMEKKRTKLAKLAQEIQLELRTDGPGERENFIIS